MTHVAREERAASESHGQWPLYLIGAMFVAAFLGLLAWNIELPYLALSPGPVSDAADSVIVEGVAFYPPEGELLMLTAISQDVNVFEAAIAGVDPTVDLVPKQTKRREGETDEQYRNRVLQQMDDSNFRAIAAALGYLGYELKAVEVVVNDLVPGAPAAEVLELGDTIHEVNGSVITDTDDIAAALEGFAPGDSVPVTVIRAGSEIELEVTLAEREDEPGRPLIGIVPGVLTEPPFPISIEAGDVGGPSAGLMHTIAIIDSLTEGELTKGRVVAGTGTIDVDGTVGNIGSVRQKVVAAEAAGAQYMFVPVGNYDAALTAERDDIEIVPVATLEEAIEFLEGLEQA